MPREARLSSVVAVTISVSDYPGMAARDEAARTPAALQYPVTCSQRNCQLGVAKALPWKRRFRATIYTVSMEEKVCRYCIHKFRPSRYHPDQKVCSSGDCQRRRRTDYHRKKLVEDPVYREQCRDSQQKWREKNPQYMKRYWADRRAGDRLNAKKSHLTSELNQLLKLAKNNSAVDLRSLDASIWLVSPDGLFKENNLASAKIIIVLGIPSSSA